LYELFPKAASHYGYDPGWFVQLQAIEDRHFWLRTRNKVIAIVVSQITANMAPGYRVLEVGCGTGNVLRFLEQTCKNGVVMGMDLFAEGLQYARRRTTCQVVQADINAPPFATQFHLIGLFDVLEHLPDDMRVLRNMHTMLAQGGILLLTVPAHPSLWSYFDEASHHCRRYQVSNLESKLNNTGYRIEYLTQYMVSIFPLLWLGRRLKALIYRRPSGSADRTDALARAELRITPVANGLLAFLLAQEARLIARRRRLPIGTSLLAIARKE
jgi:SAM-dependent methyltransferase